MSHVADYRPYEQEGINTLEYEERYNLMTKISIMPTANDKIEGPVSVSHNETKRRIGARIDKPNWQKTCHHLQDMYIL